MRKSAIWLSLALIALVGVPAFGQSVAISPEAFAPAELCHYDLLFIPNLQQQLVVSVTNDQSWDYGKKSGMKGSSKKTATLNWRFRKDGQKGYIADGQFAKATYKGESVKNGKVNKSDIAWSLKKGYTKGKDSYTDKTWFAGEMREGISMPIDKKGQVRPGEC